LPLRWWHSRACPVVCSWFLQNGAIHTARRISALLLASRIQVSVVLLLKSPKKCGRDPHRTDTQSRTGTNICRKEDRSQWPHSMAPSIPGFRTPRLFTIGMRQGHCLPYQSQRLAS
jgi:hypothetical protein